MERSARWRGAFALVVVAVLGAGCTVSLSGAPAAARATSHVTPTSQSVSSSTPSLPPPIDAPAPGPATTPTQIPTTTHTSTAPPAVNDPRTIHDRLIDTTVATMAAQLARGDKTGFLAHFAANAALASVHRIGLWFTNTRSLGVSRALFVRTPGYLLDEGDGATSFSRTVVLGVRTPYDDDDSLPGVTYTVTMTKGSAGWRISVWNPAYVVDPLNCDCMLSVVHNNRMAVVTSDHHDLAGWPKIVLAAGTEGVDWVRSTTSGSGLRVPKGQVIFLADAPYRWFLSFTRPAEQSNATISMTDAGGRTPGQAYSAESRIVVILVNSDGDMAPQDDRGRQYVSDVITHESTHQMMSRNSALDYDTEGSPITTWEVEGIAVAVEILHRRNDPASKDVGYPQSDDPRNADRDWLVDHVTTTLPTTAQLYESQLPERNYWYGVAGSVFLYLQAKYGYPEMLRAAGLTYAKNNSSVFRYFPDPARPGHFLTAAVATSRWLQWFRSTYER